MSAAGLISSYHLLPIAKDVIRKWANEVLEALSSKTVVNHSIIPYLASSTRQIQSFITQYHALGLLYVIRSHDRMAVMKMVQQFSSYQNRGSSAGNIQLKNPFAIVLLARYAAKVMEDDPR